MKKRAIFAKIWDQIDSPDVLLLNGARQVGKTSLLKMVAQKLLNDRGVAEAQIHFFDLEQTEDLAIWTDQQKVIARPFVRQKRDKQYVFIDEFQRSFTIGSTLKVLHDHYPHIKCLITGSASWYLNIDESLAGRKRVISIWPLTFSEYLNWQEEPRLIEDYQLITNQLRAGGNVLIEELNLRWLEFLSFGGYPAVVLESSAEQKKILLSEIIDARILRDVQLHNYAAEPLQVRKLLALLANQEGGLLHTQNLATNTELSRTVVLNRLSLLQHTFILHTLLPYFTNKIKELTRNPKVFLVDTGLGNTLRQDFAVDSQSANLGRLAENFAIMELLKQRGVIDSVHYWRTRPGQEVDIVLRRQSEIIPLEVKSGIAQTIPTGLKAFIRQYHVPRAYVLNWSTVQTLTYQNCQVHFRPLWWPIIGAGD